MIECALIVFDQRETSGRTHSLNLRVHCVLFCYAYIFFSLPLDLCACTNLCAPVHILLSTQQPITTLIMTMRMYAELFAQCLCEYAVRLPFKFVLFLFLDFLQRRTCIMDLIGFLLHCACNNFKPHIRNFYSLSLPPPWDGDNFDSIWFCAFEQKHVIMLSTSQCLINISFFSWVVKWSQSLIRVHTLVHFHSNLNEHVHLFLSLLRDCYGFFFLFLN